MAYLTGITGGIGSGKSIVSKILTELGYQVYDCDSRAKTLMDSSDAIKNAIRTKIAAECVDSDNCIDRKKLSSIVFSDISKLDILNSIVHKAIREDVTTWAATLNNRKGWIESAILYESKLDKMVDDVWEVMAPEDLRIKRVMKRNNVSAEEVKKRIESQQRSSLYTKHPNTKIVVNDDVQPLLMQILRLVTE